ncbi:uncharacterized protein LOC112178274 [Rosa chinensis]|uniref:uncharacterized protein LOC112178274 n=1 Tax=Rosa chinensis TaxID=74649 RepID=UPI000D09619D|nr:uncharacterized protein LOC112178274 [Rosa chinensis]
MLIDVVASHELLSFMDGTAGYLQIPVAIEDRHKTAFHYPCFMGVFEYVVMPFGLKNAGATYWRAMDMIFHAILGKILEVYIDDVVVKSMKRGNYITNLRKYVPQKAVKDQAIADFLVHHPMLDVPDVRDLEVLLELGVRDMLILKDSLLVINQLREKFKCTIFSFAPYLERALKLLLWFDDVDLEHILEELNFAANELA